MSISKLEVHNAAIGVKSVDFESGDAGRVPDNLADLTLTVIGLHRANGHLGWLVNVVTEAEAEGRIDDPRADLVEYLQNEAIAPDVEGRAIVLEALAKFNLLP